jgi:hypothetical protein
MSHRDRIPFCTGTDNDHLGDSRHIRMVPERLSSVDVRQMHLGDRKADRGECVGDRD